LGSLPTFAAFAHETNVKPEGEWRECGAISTGQRNTCIETLCRSFLITNVRGNASGSIDLSYRSHEGFKQPYWSD
jgi:hypothetical protein